MLQIILKNYGYYESKIDGDFGPASKKALKEFQNSNDLISDGILGNNTCNALINKQSIVRKTSNTNSISNSQSTVIFNAQNKLTELGLYSGNIDGINGTQTKNAVKNFQNKAGLTPDGVIGPLTLSALEKGEQSYITVETSNQNTNNIGTVGLADLIGP